jgi:hypothetical protein
LEYDCATNCFFRFASAYRVDGMVWGETAWRGKWWWVLALPC